MLDSICNFDISNKKAIEKLVKKYAYDTYFLKGFALMFNQVIQYEILWWNFRFRYLYKTRHTKNYSKSLWLLKGDLSLSIFLYSETLSIPIDAFSLKERKRLPLKSDLDISCTII